MKSNSYLVLDQGGHSSRALVFDASGRLLAQAAVPVATDKPKLDWVEQNPAELVESLRQAANLALQRLRQEQRNCLLAAALVTQRSSLVCWHKITGEALYPVISWQDRRGAQWLSQQNIDTNWIHQRTGLTLSAHYGASKIRWCLDHLAQVKQTYDNGCLTCGPLASWLIGQLTDSKAARVDPANASRTLLWNMETLDWDEELLLCFGIEQSLLPKLTATQSDYGLLVLDEISLPLRLVNGDQSAAIFAMGDLSSDTAYVNLGTGAFISVPWAQTKACPKFLLKSLVHQSDTVCFVVEGTVNGAASALDWAQQYCGLENLDRLDDWAKKEKTIPLFINGIAGLGSPYWCEMSPEFVGDGSKEQKLVAVLESIVFLLQINLGIMSKNGFDGSKIQVSGGLSQLDSLCQKLADISGLIVFRPQQVEASARGAAFWLAGRPSDWQVVASDRFLPSRQGSMTIKRRFLAWQQVLQERLKRA